MDLKKIDSTGIEPEGGVPTQKTFGGNGITALEGIATGDEGPVVSQIAAMRSGAFESSLLKGAFPEHLEKPSTDGIASESITLAKPATSEETTLSPEDELAKKVELAQQNLVNKVVSLLEREKDAATAAYVKRTGIEFLVLKYGLEIPEKWKKFLRILRRVEGNSNLSLSHELESNFCPKKISEIRDKKRHARAKATYTGDYPGRESLTIPADTNFSE